MGVGEEVRAERGGDRYDVLYVNNDPTTLERIASALETADDRLTVTTASNAEQALSRLDTDPIDCIVSDYHLDDTDGLALLRTVRDQRPELPFILFTDNGSEMIASDAISAGVTDYLQKDAIEEQYTVLANRIRRAVAEQNAQKALEERERQLTTLISNLPGMVYRSRNERTWPMEFVSEGCFELTGYEPEELMEGEVLWGTDIIKPDHRELLWEAVQAALDERVPFEVTYEIETRNGETKWVWEQGRGVFDEDNEVVALEGFITDISERKEREQAITALHDVSRELMGAETVDRIAKIGVRTAESVLDMPYAVIYDWDSETTQLQPRATAMATDLSLGDPVTIDPEDRPIGAAFDANEVQIVEDTHVEDVTLPVADDDDHPATLRSLCAIPLDEYGVLAIGSMTPDAFDRSDIDIASILAANVEAALTRADREAELRDRERELQRQNERLEEFANVVSHDLRNPLNVATGNAELLADDIDDERLDKIRTALDRMDQLIENVLALARQGESVKAPEPVDLETTIKTAWTTVETGDATLSVDVDGSIAADRSRLIQLLENLFRNAIEHGGSDVTVEAGMLTDPDGFYIADSGTGIPDRQRDRVFDSGFSTADHGNGFGLAIVEEIAKAHGWSVSVGESDAGGACFAITGVDRQ
ncbi:MAG: response regulator [Halobacteriales archaeon]|nr:response regulator [Halobacteriales archaeon]